MRKNTKKALILSCLSLLLCVSMLVGTTFAWFTDNESVSVSKIEAGTLDIELYKVDYSSSLDVTGTETKITDSKEPIFDYDKWEPGYVQFVNLRVKNEGTLAAKWQATLTSSNVGKLAEVIEVYVAAIPVAQGDINLGFGSLDDRELVFNGHNATYVGMLDDIVANGTPIFDSVKYGGSTCDSFGVLLKMQETAGNIYQGKEAGTFDIRIQATQDTVENDSFDNQYDANAQYADSVATAEELEEVLTKANETGEPALLVLEDDISVTSDSINVGAADATIDLNGKTITVSGDGSAANDRLFYTEPGADLVITGNGTIDFGDSISCIAVGGYGSITIENGTFIRNKYTDADKFYPLIENTRKAEAGTKLVINGGYFDSGYYALKADGTPDCFNNCRQLINSTWSNCDIVVYGGTFVGANPAWGDEGMAHLCTVCGGNTYCQQLFLEGQNREDTKLPDGYTITESTLTDGRPVFTVNYSK